jgi:uncharacterized protein Usg
MVNSSSVPTTCGKIFLGRPRNRFHSVAICIPSGQHGTKLLALREDAASALIINNLFNFKACNNAASLKLFPSWELEGTMVSKETKATSVSSAFRKQLEGYGLTTANILYRRPDHPWLLQEYVWQEYDLCPNFPVLNKFLNFWLEKLEGPLHSVTVAHSRLIKPAEIRAIGGEFRLH